MSAPSARPLRFFDTGSADLTALVASLEKEPKLALDTESDPFHRYFEKICLIQVSTLTEDFVLDPLALGLPPELRKILEDPARTVVLHGADYDVRSLHRSFELVLGRVFDTLIAANLLGLKELGLKALLETELGISITKTEQRSDWGRRPLSDKQLEYARQDTMHLLLLAEKMRLALEEKGRIGWLEEECELLRRRTATPRVFDREGWKKLKGAKRLKEPGRRALAGAFQWREEKAKSADLPPFRVLRNESMVEIAEAIDAEGLPVLAAFKRSKLVPRNIDGAALYAAIERALREDPDPGRPPKTPKTPSSDPSVSSVSSVASEELDEPVSEGPTDQAHRYIQDPVTKKRLDLLRAARLLWSKELGLDPGFLISQNVLERLAREPPSTVADLASVRGMTDWRIGAIGHKILQVLDA